MKKLGAPNPGTAAVRLARVAPLANPERNAFAAASAVPWPFPGVDGPNGNPANVNVGSPGKLFMRPSANPPAGLVLENMPNPPLKTVFEDAPKG